MRGVAALHSALLTLLCAVAVGLAVFLASGAPARAQEATPVPVTEPASAAEEPAGEAAEPAGAETAPLQEGTPVSGAAAPTATLSITGSGTAAPDQACRLCHVGSTDVKIFPSGEEMPVGVDPAVLDSSVHGVHNTVDIYCTDCHQPRQRYRWPHEESPAQSIHEFEQEVAANCQSCHMSLELHNPGHLQAEDTANLPVCTDCHGGHDVAPVAELYAAPTAFCQSCHAIADMGAVTAADAQVRWAHERVLPQLEAHEQAVASGASTEDGPTCRTCHNDQPPSQVAAQSEQCIACHGLLDATRERGDGEPVELHVDVNDILTSVHGERVVQGVDYPPLGCMDCHRSIGEAGFPHPEELLVDREALRTRVEESCIDCHQEAASQYADGIHSHAIENGELNAASCADCHGSHNIQPPNEPRTRISETCGTCHEEITEQYKTSVHGAALYGEDNPDVPVCTDCHAAHDIVDPTTAAFRLSSPQMCGECHADVDLMAKYDISTNVFDSYVSDFHGTTVTLFQHNSPNEPTNKAVCYDCHGIHDIASVSDATAEQIQQRLLVTCQKCHPDASENFPSSWMSHYEPSLERYPLVYLVDLFYTVFIPTILGGFMLFIGSDIFRRATDSAIQRRQRRRRAPVPPPAGHSEHAGASGKPGADGTTAGADGTTAGADGTTAGADDSTAGADDSAAGADDTDA